ncbi:MAG: sodium:solute symporter, partial [Bacteroidaceae bacterium]|nr:sodium:solute symporter [Bacteroidaceae bacterium]
MFFILIAYFSLLLILSKFTSKKDGNDAFYRGERKSSWQMVAYGMIGASISGVSFVSVPGMVMYQDMTYLQTCFGFIIGYFIVAFVLLPIYYRLNLTSIYEFLVSGSNSNERKAASLCFVVSDLLGSAVKFFLVCAILQNFVFEELGVPFVATVPLMVAFIWLYTKRGGVKTLVYTDVFQTTFMLAALVGIIITLWLILKADITSESLWYNILNSNHFRIFEFNDYLSTQNFWKQLLSGAFIVVVMTGLNQNMMQKNLTCKTLKAAQKDMSLLGFLFVPVNFLFLVLGVMLLLWIEQCGMTMPAKGDDLLPLFIQSEGSLLLKVLFVLGIVSAAFSSADSSLTALTTSVCVDVAEKEHDVKLRKRVHIGISLLFVMVVYALQYFGSKSLIDLVYVLVSYTYGPLLGMFGYKLYNDWR